MKNEFKVVFAMLFALASGFAQATEISFPVETYHFAYHAEGDVHLTVATGDWAKRAEIVFVRGAVPADPVHYDASSGVATLTYAISELENVRALIESSSFVYFNYVDWGTSESGYLYTNP